MHPSALPTRFLFQTRALPADAERVLYSMALDAHDAPTGRAANRDGVRAEAIAGVLRPDDILNRTSSDLGEPAAFGTNDHEPCLAALSPATALPGRRRRSRRRKVGEQIGRVHLEEIQRLGQALKSPGAQAPEADPLRE